MARETTYNGVLGKWERLNSALAANSADVPMLEASRVLFEQLLNQARDAAQRQALHTAGKQDASRELKTLVAEGERMATMLRQGLKARYGIRSEKLVEFGLQPFRGKPRKAKPASEEPESPTTKAADPDSPSPTNPHS